MFLGECTKYGNFSVFRGGYIFLKPLFSGNFGQNEYVFVIIGLKMAKKNF